jgi:hypothetical protein
MVRSVLSLALAALTLLPSPTTAYQVVKDGPDVLDECAACPFLYKTFYTCARTVSQPTRTNVSDCVCPPPASADSDNGWYPYIEACAGCLPRSESSESRDFWSNMSSMFWQTVNSCRGDRNVTSDAEGVLCVASPKMENCMAMRDASEGPTWVGYRLFGNEERNSNRTKVLNLAAFKVNSTSSEATPKTTAPGTATGLEGVAASTTTLAATTTGAGGQAATTTTGSSLAAARLNQGSPAGYALGGLVVAGIVGLV